MAGCGGGGSSNESGKSEFVARANAICAEGNREGQQIQSRLFPESGKISGVQVQEFFTQVLPVFKRTDEKLAALTAPSGDEQEVAALLAAARRGESGVEEAAKTPVRAKAALQKDPFAEFSAQAKAYGLTTCAGG